MSSKLNSTKCKSYESIDMEKLLLWMDNSYIFYYSCENCTKCNQCKNIISDVSN